METLLKTYWLPCDSHLIAFLLVLLFSLEVESQTIEMGILRDVSEISNGQCILDETEMFRTILTQLELQNSSKGVNLRTAVFGVNRIPEVELAQLPEQNRFFGSTSQRNKDMNTFLIKAKRDVGLMVEEPCGQNQTNLYRALVHMTKQFDSQADQTFLVVISDFILVSSAFNFNTYIDNPSKMVGEDYESIVQTLKRDGELPDMSGTKVVLVTPQTNDLEMWAARFWEKYFSIEKGAAVKIRASF